MSAAPPSWLLLPGLDGTGELFRWFLPYLHGQQVVVARYPPDPRWSLADHVEYVAGLALGMPRCIVVAESFSGAVALRLRQHDARIAGIVLVASFARCPRRMLHLLPLWSAPLLRRLAASPPLLRWFCLGRDAEAGRVATLAAVVAGLPPRLLAARLRLVRELDDRAVIMSADTPVLHLRARHDRLVRIPLLDGPHPSWLHEIDIDGPHFLLQTRPEACWQAIRQWSEDRDLCG